MNLKDLAKAKFKTTRKKSSSKNMAGKKRKSSSKRKGNSSTSNGAFGGKVLGFKIPFVSDILKNKTLQKSLAATGAVTTLLTIASLINNPTINKVANNEIVQLGLAGATGDIVGVGTQLVRTRGLSKMRSQISNVQGGQPQTSLVPMAGNGVA